MLNLDYRDARPIYEQVRDGLLRTFDETATELCLLGRSADALPQRLSKLDGGVRQ